METRLLATSLDRELNEVKQEAQKELERTIAAKNKAHHAKMKEAHEKHAKELQEKLRVIEEDQALMQEENREDNRRLEQSFADQILRLDRKREKQINQPDERLARERDPHNTQLQQVIDKHQEEMRIMTEASKLEKGTTRVIHEKELENARLALQNAQQEADNWMKIQAQIDARLRAAEIENIDASGSKKAETMKKVEELREEKSSTWGKTWDRVMQGLTTVATIADVGIAILGLPIGI